MGQERTMRGRVRQLGHAVHSRPRWKGVLILLVPLAVASTSLTACVADPPPRMVGAVARDHSAIVTWLPPLASNAGIVAYVVTPFVNQVAQTPTRFNSTATTQTVTGLTNSMTYTFVVTAIDGLGADTAS